MITPDEKNREFTQSIELITGAIFEKFKSNYAINHYYDLNVELLTNALFNAKTDIERAATYQSDSGADRYRKIAYYAKWISCIKPIQVGIFPVNLTNYYHLGLQRINAAFSVFIIDCAMISTKRLSDSLLRDLRYCFEFRHEMPAEAIALILKHYYPQPQNL